jgi:adenosylmethionine---8-amino-7-oxononanoate aminotransferase
MSEHKISLSERDRRAVWHPFTQMRTAGMALPIVRGEGARLYDESGNAYIDAIASWWMNLHGHANPYLAQRLFEQAQQLEHVIFANFTHSPAVELAERLLEVLPDNQDKIFYSDNGSTAVEVAIKMSLQFWYNQAQPKRTKIIALHGAYHGDTFGAMSVGARSAFNRPFEALLFEVLWIDAPSKNSESLAQLQAIHAQHGQEIAAFIFEPLVQGAGGMLMHEAEELDKLLEFCGKNKIIRIADEVMTGFGRTGRFFATDYCQHKPDIFCLSKGLTAGMLPLGVTSCTGDIFEAFCSDTDIYKTFFHGHSHAGNPLACAVGVASLDLLQTADRQADIARIVAAHAQFAELLRRQSSAQNVRQCGVILAFDWQDSPDELPSYLNRRSAFIWEFFIKRRIILRPLGNTIYILPPYCITSDELQSIYTAILELLQQNAPQATHYDSENLPSNGDIFI